MKLLLKIKIKNLLSSGGNLENNNFSTHKSVLIENWWVVAQGSSSILDENLILRNTVVLDSTAPSPPW